MRRESAGIGGPVVTQQDQVIDRKSFEYPRHPFENGCVNDDHPGQAVPERSAQPVAPLIGVDRHPDRPEAIDGEHEGYQFRAILRIDGDRVAGPDAEVGQPPGQTVRQSIHVGIGPSRVIGHDEPCLGSP